MNLDRYKVSVVLNLVSALTVAVYYLFLKEHVVFNIAAIGWYVMFFVNMAICLESSKGALFRAVAMVSPVVLMFLQVFAVHNGDTLWAAIQVLAFLYFIFSAWHAWYLGSSRFSACQPKRRLILFAVLLALLAIVCLPIGYFVLRMTIAPAFTMLSPAAFGAGTIFLIPVLLYSLCIAVLRHANIRGYRPVKVGILTIVGILILGDLMPVFAAVNGIGHAEKQFSTVYGDDADPMILSVPEMVFGSRVNGFAVEYDKEYATMAFAEEGGEVRDYALKYDLYKSAGKQDWPLPVLIRMHGSGGDKGMMNNPLMSQSIAAAGYAVFDIQYGNEVVKPANDKLAENVAQLLNYLYEHRKALNIDTDHIVLSGGSRGGKMALMTAANWANNKYHDLYGKVTIKGAVIFWGYMEDVFDRPGAERIISLTELSDRMPPLLHINATNDGSVQGGYLMKGALLPHNVKVANVELRFGMHGADTNFYGPWGQMCEHYLLRFLRLHAKPS